MMTKKILIAALLACAFGPALAGDMGFEEEPQAERRIVTRTGGDDMHLRLADALNMANVTGGDTTVIHLPRDRVVKNAPYSGELVSERTQTLGDGNQITRKTSSTSYRDSAGRTRIEVRNQDGEVVTVTIHDPVEGVRYILRPRDKSAIKVSAPGAAAIAARAAARAAAGEARAAGAHARIAGEQARLKIEELRKEGKLPDGVRERIIVKQVERSANGEHKDVQIRVAEVAEARIAARVAPMIAGAIGEHKWATKAETKDLGTREFNGVKATGTQRSYEIPAGEIGNRDAIVVSTETWTSPELQAVVYQKRTDPRAGDFVLRLENLKREEPAAALFAVPSDYTVKDPSALAKAAAEKAAAAVKAEKNG
ncbi:hypothetical protein [Massilia yuzhufengensis]|uniref:Uncharacterized protein n=1 Tax=Massilia yuzhufengensis TaxID=1164594 RepID=A0A1I1UFT8_9BURK|nr:hypothetical protein [Massilia yuzhufengensis]SFD69564.1 hypothetical protein SAMN05216204_13353 [Massilia yuzhufengensis]